LPPAQFETLHFMASSENNSPARISVEASGVQFVATEHSLLFEAAESLLWLRACRTATNVTVSANLPIVVLTGSLCEAVLARSLHEVVLGRHCTTDDAAVLESLAETRRNIEGGEIWSTRWIGAAEKIFPNATHPQCHAFLHGPTTDHLLRFFDLQNIAAHGAGVWTDFKLPKSLAESSEFLGIRRERQQPLFDALAAQGFSIEDADPVHGLTQLFSRNDLVDVQCRAVWAFLRGLGSAIRSNAPDDWTAYHNCGIVWPQIAQALTGGRECF
jgi:hypothetical protein